MNILPKEINNNISTFLTNDEIKNYYCKAEKEIDKGNGIAYFIHIPRTTLLFYCMILYNNVLFYINLYYFVSYLIMQFYGIGGSPVWLSYQAFN